MNYRNHVLLGLARLSPQCFGCGKRNEGEVVAAHANEGKAMGMKNPDYQVAFLGTLCCHARLDQGNDMTREDKRAFWMRAFWATQEWLWSTGYVAAHVQPVAQPIPKPRPKAKISSGQKIASRPFAKPNTPRKIPSRPFPKRKP